MTCDPFDRVLIAQARIEGVPVMTSDPVFRAYSVELIFSMTGGAAIRTIDTSAALFQRLPRAGD